MSSDDEDGFGGLFAGADEPEPEYPIETLVVDRLVLSREGTTNSGFTPLYDRFDCPPTASTKAAGCHRLDALAPPPLLVKYRNKRHSLWGHRLWNAAKYLTKRIDEGAIDVFNKTVLELGAGLGVPTLSAYRNGARLSVVTDYPDADLMDIIRLNVEENCVPDLMDTDVKARYAQMEQPVDGGVRAAAAPRCIAEPLLWGNRAHIEKVMSYTTGGSGFDVVILSDILFNHVCNDDLADTVSQMMAKTPSAAAYCVFSHHRAFKQLQDFEFFDKCVARGLCYEQIDEEAYPMMFPEDRGPESVRMPVKCYRITHRVDLAGPAVMDALPSQATYDVIIQGTGLTMAYLSAALSRSGVKVLHCDGAGVYGGPCQTYTVSQFKAALGHVTAGGEDEHSQRPGRSLITGRILQDRTSACFDEQTLRQFAIDVLPTTYMANGETLQTLVEANMVRTVEFQRVARFLFLIPHGSAPPSTGGGGGGGADGVSFAVREVPLTRGSVFATDMMSVLDKRRLMKFVKDVEASLAEQLHAKTANPADNPYYQGAGSQADAARDATDAFLAGVAAQTPPCTTLRELLTSKYGVSPAALDVITLLGELDLQDGEVVRKAPSSVSASDTAATFDSQAALVQSILLVRQLLTSVGVFNGHTPFLLPCYGASELPQSLCRTSAVWGGQFMLRRSVHHITLEDETERQCAVLSNGQAIRAKVVIVPEEIADEVPIRLHDWEHAWLRAVSIKKAQQQREQGQKVTADGETPYAELSWIIPSAVSTSARDSETSLKDKKSGAVAYARVVVVAKTPLFSWKALAECGVATARPDVDIEGAPPVLVALLRVTSDGLPAAVACSAGEEDANAAVVHVAQHSAGSEQATEDGSSVVVHFTADAHTLNEDALLAFVTRTFLDNDTSSSSTATAVNTQFGWREPETAVALLASFTLDAHHAAQAGQVPDSELVDPPSETWKSHDFALQECAKLTKATRNDRHNLLHDAAREGEESERDVVVPPQAPLTADTLEAELRAQQPTEAMALPDWACVLSVPTLRSRPLYDGQYLEMASSAYARVMAKLGRGEETLNFLQRQPDAPV